MELGGMDTKETEEFLADLDKLAITDEQGFVDVRIGVVVTLLFLDGNTPEKRLAFTEVLRHYHSIFGKNITHYQKLGAGRLTKIRDISFLEHYAQNAVRPVADDSEDPDINAFTPHLYGYPDGKEKDEPSLYYCGGHCTEISDWFPPGSVSYLDAYIPASWVAVNGYSALTEMAKHWCELLNPTSGTAGLGALFNQGRSRDDSGLTAFPLVRRFPGLDYNDTRLWLVESEDAGNRVIRTTNWLNVLDDGFVEQLGGLEKIRQELGEACPVHVYDGGVIIQAGPEVALGDINRGIIPEHYRTVARLLKPLRFEDYQRSLLQVPHPLDDVEETLAWIRRFD